MRKLFIFLVSCLLGLVASCTTVPNAGTKQVTNEAVDRHIKQLVDLWSENVPQLDETTFNRLFDTWAQVIWMDGSGKKQLVRQEPAITKLLKNKLYSSIPLSDVPADSIKVNHNTETGKPQAVISLFEPKTRILFEFSNPAEQDVLEDIKIEKLFIFEYYEEKLKPGDFQKWADTDNNGFLDQDEQEHLYVINRSYNSYHGIVRNSLDDYFDRNEDGYIDDIEKGYAEEVLHFDLLHRMYSAFPYIAKNYVDTDAGAANNIWLGQAAAFYDEVFNPDFTGSGRRNTIPWDKMADFNKDSYVNKEELDYYQHLVGMKLSLMPAPPVAPKDTLVLHNDVKRWADFNGDGDISSYEMEDVAWKIYEFLSDFHNMALNPLDSFFNLNQNFFIDKYEKEYALSYLLSRYIKSVEESIPGFVSNFIDINSNGKIDNKEIKEAGEFLFISINQGRDNKLDIDEKIDVNKNGRIDVDEFDNFRGTLTLALAGAWLKDSDENADRWDVVTRLDQLADLNHDGIINSHEREQAAAAFRREHKVSSAFDKIIDSDNNGTIDKYEIENAQQKGIVLLGATTAAASVSNAGSGSGKSLAIVKTTSPDKKLEQSVGEIILSFIQNAFITSGRYRIVDRRNLDAVIKEQKLSLSGLVKESEAVEVGQIAGAELIGVAELYKLDGAYYLNLKLLSSTSGEVVDSSIAQAGAIGEFLSMCTNAVNTLNN